MLFLYFARDVKASAKQALRSAGPLTFRKLGTLPYSSFHTKGMGALFADRNREASPIYGTGGSGDHSLPWAGQTRGERASWTPTR